MIQNTMKVKNMNHSSFKTKAAIRAAFAEMLEEKGDLDKITVTELVRRADINRSTFYLHYSDIYDIVSEIENSLMNEILDNFGNTRESLFQCLENLLDLVHRNETMYRQVLTTDSPVYFLRRARRKVAAKILEIPDINKEPTAFTSMKVEIFVDGLCEQIVYYFRGQNNYSFEEFKEGLLACAQAYF